MSSISLVADYESDPEDSPQSSTFNRLPVPSIISEKSSDNSHIDDPEKHKGRIRSFPHERGNWSTYVYIPFKPNKKLFCFTNILLRECSKIAEFDIIEDFHLSLSKTVILKYHWISSFFSSLKNISSNIYSFSIDFDSLDVYTNEDKTRTFIGLKTSEASHENLENIVAKIDELLLDFNLPTFYKNPSFHVSLVWCLGNKEKELNSLIESFRYTLQEFSSDIDLSTDSFSVLKVSNINCRSGNKICSFSVKDH